MARCWRCGGGKTISVTTTGTHVLPCPTCDGTGETAVAPAVAENGVAGAKPRDVNLVGAGSKTP